VRVGDILAAGKNALAIAQHGGRIVYKPFDLASWKDGAETWVAFATPLTEDQLVDDAILQLAPGLYQAVVPRAYELRVTVSFPVL